MNELRFELAPIMFPPLITITSTAIYMPESNFAFIAMLVTSAAAMLAAMKINGVEYV